MRLGGPIPTSAYATAQQWLDALNKCGYRAAFCPLPIGAADADIATYRDAAMAGDIVIAEVGAWSNPMSPDPETRRAAVEKCKASLALAEAIGARCSVNVVGSLGDKWDGPDSRDVTQEAFDRIVTSIREIIDAVAPQRAMWTIEMMPRMLPDSADSYLELIDAIDRPALGVHFDPVNIINSPRRYYDTGAVIRDCFAKLGPRIVSCHAKDIMLTGDLTVHLDECRPGTGKLDYVTFLRELDALDADTPLMLEHLATQDEYAQAADHIRSIADQEGISL
jgi:sugar phosphate isomerase/epimerase